MKTIALLVALVSFALAVTEDYSTSSYGIQASWAESSAISYFELNVNDKGTNENLVFKLLVEKVSSGTFWALPGSYFLSESRNTTSTFVAPTISFDSIQFLNPSVPFDTLETIPENEAIVQTNRITSYLDNCLLVTQVTGGLQVQIRSNPTLQYQLIITAYYFFADRTFQNRQVTPRDFKMDYSLVVSSPVPQRLGLATGWWGTPEGRGTLPLPEQATSLDNVWSMVGQANGATEIGRINWVCARNATATAAGSTGPVSVLIRTRAATGTAGSQNFQFWGFFDETQVSIVTWDPLASVLTSVDSENGQEPLNVGLITGAVVGALLGGLLLALLVVVITRRQRNVRSKAIVSQLETRRLETLRVE